MLNQLKIISYQVIRFQVKGTHCRVIHKVQIKVKIGVKMNLNHRVGSTDLRMQVKEWPPLTQVGQMK